MNDMIFLGGSVKALGNGKVAGYLIQYSTADAPDLSAERDFFTAACDYDLDTGNRKSVFYAHGLDAKMGVKRLGVGNVKQDDDIGVWIESQLNMRDEYEQAIYKMAEDGKLGWSSGAPSHLVTRKAIKTEGGTVHEILTWPIAEASLTPCPADHRNTAIALKSLTVTSLDDELKATWTRKYIDSLPDASFAYVEDGADTDKGKRHLPYKDKDGKPDAAHVRAALARLDQTDISAAAKASAKRKLLAAAKELGIGDDNAKQLPTGWSYRDLMAFLESEANEDFGAQGSTDVYGDDAPSVMVWGCNLLEGPDRFVYRRTDEPGDLFARPYTIENNDAVWGDEQEVIETTTYVDAPNDDATPMLAGKQADVAALRVALRASMTLDDHASIVQDAIEGFAARAEGLTDLSAKAGRPMSAARHAKLRAAHGGMQTAHTAMASHLAAIGEMLASTDPDAKKAADELLALRMQHERIKARRLGIAV